MRHRVWLFRVLSLVCLGGALTIGVLGVAAFPYNSSPFLTRKGVGSPSEANEYYAQIGAPATFAAWYAQFFPVGGDRRADAIYYNAGDLGFGREMHCREETNFTSCYVVNHGLGASAPKADAVNDAVANTRILPTVAMVYDYTIEGQPNDVAFYVYGTDGNLINQVALDSEGAKNVPHLCLPCHGGSYNSTTNSVTGANFLPFDAPSFAYSTASGYTRADQEEAFRVLNSMVDYTFPSAEISALITGWYTATGGVNTPGAVLDDSYTAPAYNGNDADRALYHDVVKHYCRGCHVAQAFNLADPADVDGSAFSAVFETNDMPHAQVTAHNFWSSFAPTTLANRFPTQTFRVTTTADTTPNGCTPDNCTLREAILAANANPDMSVVTFDVVGVFGLSLSGVDDTGHLGDLDITEDLYLLGYSPYLTTIDGNSIDRVFHIRNGAEVVIQGVVIREGLAAIGGGIFNEATLTLNRSLVTANHATFEYSGGGLANSPLSVATINQSTFYSNTAAGHGGGIFNHQATLTINNSTLSGNSANQGGAVYNFLTGVVYLHHATIVLNHGAGGGGGLAMASNAWVEASNSIIANNTGSPVVDCLVAEDGSSFVSLGYNLVGEGTIRRGCSPTVGTDVTNPGLFDALLTPLQQDPATGILIHRPRTGSPIIDAIPLGAACQTPSYDARNVARPLDAFNNGSLGCDIGATEAAHLPVYLPLVTR